MNYLNALNYEHYCVNQHQVNYNEITYHWTNIPESVLYESGFITNFNELRLRRMMDKNNGKINSIQEYGLDGISVKTVDGKIICSGLQMKLWDGTLSGRDLGTFWQVFSCRFLIKNPLSKCYLYYSCKLEKNLSDDIKNTNGAITSVFTENPYKKKVVNKVAVKKKIVLRDYQVEAIKKLSINWSGVKLLNSPPGTGKTEIIANYLKDSDITNIFMASPLKVHANQLLNRVKKYLPKHKELLVDSDNSGTRDFNDIKNILKGKSLVSSTFKSTEDIILQLFETDCNDSNGESDDDLDSESEDENPKKVVKGKSVKIEPLKKRPRKFNKIVKSDSDSSDDESDSDNETADDNEFKYKSKYDLSNSILIVDEAHNLINNKKLIKIIKSFPRALLVTATPPSTMEEVLSCETIYKYDVDKAIENKYICDYRHYLPFIVGKSVNITIPIELTKLNNDLCKKGLFIINGLLKTGSKKCIVYVTSKKECDDFSKVLKSIMEKYHGLPVWTNSITSDTSQKQREIILVDFQKNDARLDTLKFLCAVRILDEGVDIVKCDSTFITYVDNEDDIRIFQRTSRGNRIDPENPNKVCNCFLWCEDTSKAINILTLLKNNDVEFHKKISVINSNYDVEHTAKTIADVAEHNIKLAEFIDVKCLTREQICEEKKIILFEFCDKNKRCPYQREKYKNIGIGQWFQDKKRNISTNDDIYKKLSENKYVAENLKSYIEMRELNKNDPKINEEKWIEYLFKYSNENKRCPHRKDTYCNKNIGNWLGDQKKKISNTLDDMYIKLSKNKYVKENLDKYLEYLILNKNKEVLNFDQMSVLLFEFCNKNERCIKQKETYKNQNVGKWYLTSQKSKIKNVSDDIYKKLSKNEYVKENLDEYLKHKKIKEKLKKLNFKEMLDLLFKFCDKYKRPPTFGEMYEGQNIGQWFHSKKKKVTGVNCDMYVRMSQNSYIKESLNNFVNKKYQTV